MMGSHRFGLIFVLVSPLVALSSKLCPEIPKAANHFFLTVEDKPVPLPGGKFLEKGLSYNGSINGPTIVVDYGSMVSIDVYNNASVPTSVHWHGQDLPDAAWADGVANVAQRPIPPGETFRCVCTYLLSVRCVSVSHHHL
jgi:FtsP/CotA-like multicopper oxidase with cupredoxin domain